jgi:hypothetical protein
VDSNNHACDALRYAAMMLLGVRKENKATMPFRIMNA